jgi:hypothetical protein
MAVILAAIFKTVAKMHKILKCHLQEEVINFLYQMPLFFCLPQGLIYSDFLFLKT